jgi:sporulation protein YlmC with PRC-barrel domain
MTIADMRDPGTMTGAPVHGSDGAKLGKVDAVYLDNETSRPEWAAVKSGLFGGRVSLVPLGQGDWDGGTLTVPFDKDALQNAPHHGTETVTENRQVDETVRKEVIDGVETTDGRTNN